MAGQQPTTEMMLGDTTSALGGLPAPRDAAPRAPRSVSLPAALETSTPTFAAVYEQYFDFVWRAARRLGVRAEALEDVVQETFLVVHRRLAEPRTGELRPWIYGVSVHTVRNHRRSMRRKSPHGGGEAAPDPDALADLESDGPERHAQKAEAARTLYAILEQLDDDKREVFVLVEVEQLSVTDAAEALSLNLNTVYSRLRLARAEFEEAVRRHHAQDTWRMK